MNGGLPTLRDVAKLAGVSVGTVSKYLNHPELVKERNHQAISEAIQLLKYTPNTLARQLARGKSNVVLLYIVSESAINESTWLHLLPLIQKINDELEQTPYSLQIKIGSIGAQGDTRSFLEECISGHTIDGLALLSAWDIPRETILMLLEKKFPFVLIENRCPYLEGGEILFDNKKMVEDMVSYLSSFGHQEIGFFNADNKQQHMQDRYSGFLSGMERNRLRMNPEWVWYGDFSIESGLHCMEELLQLEQRPTALICGNDNMAIGAIRAARKRGLSVPGDFSVMGIDGSIVTQAIEPPVTSMELPMAELGIAAIHSLLKRIEDPSYRMETILLSCKLVQGGSVSPPKAE